MSLIQFIVAFGVGAGLLAILVVFMFGRLDKRVGDTDSAPFVPKTLMGGLGIGGVFGIGALLARAGQNKPARMSLNTAIMTPTPGLRLISLGGSALVLVLIWSANLLDHDGGNMALKVLITALVGYAALYISGYEVRYDEDGITAPNWMFMNKHYPWEEFIFIRDDGHYLYRLRFESNRLNLQKYLVGMPTFLTFVSDLRKMQARD